MNIALYLLLSKKIQKSLVVSEKMPTFASKIIDVLESTSKQYFNGK